MSVPARQSVHARPIGARVRRAARPGVQRAFTLIELLVVVAIIAILVGAVVLSIDFRNVGGGIRDTALRTGLVMNLAADQAVYSRQQFGVRFHPDSYEFWMLAPEQEGAEGDGDTDELVWQPVLDERLGYRPTGVPTEFQLDLSGVPVVLASFEEEQAQASDEDPLKPHILFLSNGEAMPDFRITIQDSEAEFRWQVTTGELEPLVVEQLEGPP